MLAFKFLALAATAPLLVPAAYVVDTGVNAREMSNVLYVRTALEDYEPNANATALDKRTSISDCIKIAAAVNTCFELANNIRAIGSSIASLISGSSGAHDCSVHTGSIDGIQWRYSATGQNCDTTAELTTIRGAVDAFLEHLMTHGGTWTGFLSVTPTGSPAPPDCGTTDYGSCVATGTKDDLGARSAQMLGAKEW
ncbi:hypothetical protein FB451DRAFT_1193644 [Mycena latifolia]|nr:hypothetical protein FB451DRAFT_1193644 [Mycena latifolia]